MNDAVAADKSIEAKSYPSAAVILSVAAIGTLVLVLWLLRSGVNYQETFNVYFANHPDLSPFTQASADNPMPIYFWLIHLLGNFFTVTTLELRLFSLGCYLLALPAIYLLGVAATSDKRIGGLATVLFGLSPFMLWYASRGTMYALLVLAAILNQWFFVRILNKHSWAWPGYIISGLLTLGIHYFYAVMLLAQLAFYAVKNRDYSRRMSMMMMVGGIIFAVSFFLWMRYLALNADILSRLPYTGKPSATNTFIIYVQFMFGFQSVVTTTLIIALWPLLVVLALFAVQKYVRPPVSVQYFLAAAVAPVLVVFALSWAWKPLFLSSYLIICLPAFLLLISWYLVAFELKALSWARRALVAIMAVMLVVQLLNIPRALREDYLGTTPATPVVNERLINLQK